jgi:hypothetical protein
MISELLRVCLAVVRAARLSGEGEVVHPGNAEHSVVDSVTFEAAVAEDLPGLHAREDVLDAGADLFVGLVVCFLPVRKVFAFASAVGHDESGAGVAAVGDGECLADGGLGAGFLPRLAVVAVSGKRPAHHDDQASVGIDDDLVVGRVPVILGLLGHRVVPVGTRVPSTMSTVPLVNRLRGWSASIGPRWSMMRSAADLDTPKSGASWRIVKFVRQYAATSRARSSSGRLHGRPLRTASAPSRRSTVTSLPKRRGLSPVNGAIQDGSDAVITPATSRSSHP